MVTVFHSGDLFIANNFNSLDYEPRSNGKQMVPQIFLVLGLLLHLHGRGTFRSMMSCPKQVRVGTLHLEGIFDRLQDFVAEPISRENL